MRLWSLHPQYLDPQGLVALWREGLLAKKVLENKTKGYRNHPQLNRFKDSPKTLAFINLYLHFVCDEADSRGYSFDRMKLLRRKMCTTQITVSAGQIDYEWQHLQKKLKLRSPEQFKKQRELKRLKLHPIFKKIAGDIEAWEVLEMKDL